MASRYWQYPCRHAMTRTQPHAGCVALGDQNELAQWLVKNSEPPTVFKNLRGAGRALDRGLSPGRPQPDHHQRAPDQHINLQIGTPAGPSPNNPGKITENGHLGMTRGGRVDGLEGRSP